MDDISSTGHAMSPATIVIGKRRRTTTHAVLHEVTVPNVVLLELFVVIAYCTECSIA